MADNGRSEESLVTGDHLLEVLTFNSPKGPEKINFAEVFPLNMGRGVDHPPRV